MADSPTLAVAEYVSAERLARLPLPVVAQAKACIEDTAACILKGSQSDEIHALRDALRHLVGNPQVSLPHTVMLLAAAAHVTEYDDSHKRSKTHPGSVVIPAALAAARLAGATGARFLSGVVAGYEVATRVGMALGAAEHRLAGWHATATAGIFGAAAAAAHVLGLDGAAIADGLGTAGTQSAGLWAFLSDGAMSKPLHAAKASHDGLLAAVLAQSGFTGSRHIFEAPDGGFFSSYAPKQTRSVWESTLLQGLGTHYEILEVAFKPYPCCRTTHAAIDAALVLADELPPFPDIRRIIIRTYGVALRQCGFFYPNQPRTAPFSLPYVVATVLRNRRPIISSDFSPEQLRDPDVTAIQEKIVLEQDPQLDACFPNLWPCVLRVEAFSGRAWERRIDVAKGDPRSPLHESERLAKLQDCAGRLLPPEQIGQILAIIRSLETQPDVNDLAAVLHSALN